MVGKRGYGGIPAGQRSTRRRAQILDAALEVVGAAGFDGLTVSGLCRDTGLNNRYLYEHFDSREAMFIALIDRLTDEMVAALVTAAGTAGNQVGDIVGAAVRAAVELLTTDPRKARVFTEAPAHADSRHRDVRNIFVALLQAQAQLRFRTVTETDDMARHLKFAGTHLFGALLETIAAWLAGDLDMTRSELADHSTELFMAVLNHVLAVSVPNS